MNQLLDGVQHDLFNATTWMGAVFYGLLFLTIAVTLSTLIRSLSKRLETHLTDVTGLRFITALAHLIIFLIAFVLYAHLIPQLRTLGTTLLAGVSLISIVLGLAAQNTLSNLIAGVSLVLYRPIGVGDNVQLTTPAGLTSAKVEVVSLGYTILRDTEGREIIVPNSVMAGGVIIRTGKTSA